jgi:hypothetical protein
LVVLLYLLTYSAFIAFCFSFTCSQSSFHLLHGGYHLKLSMLLYIFFLWNCEWIQKDPSLINIHKAINRYPDFKISASLWNNFSNYSTKHSCIWGYTLYSLRPTRTREKQRPKNNEQHRQLYCCFCEEKYV